jgi:hypothetical protein
MKIRTSRSRLGLALHQLRFADIEALDGPTTSGQNKAPTPQGIRGAKEKSCKRSASRACVEGEGKEGELMNLGLGVAGSRTATVEALRLR